MKKVDFELRVRITYWATKGVTVRVNGEKQKIPAAPASFVSLSGTWADGDTVTVEIPISLHLWKMPDDPNVASIFYGPLVLAGGLETESLTDDKVYGAYHATGDPGPAPHLVVDGDDLSAWVHPVEGSVLTFRTVNAGRPSDVTLVPFYKLFNKRYAIYWELFTEKEWEEYEAKQKARAAEEEKKQKMLQVRLVDSVLIGNRESEKAHNIESERSSSGRHMRRSWRHATSGGWFSYDLKVLPNKSMALMCTYWGSDLGRTFDILVDGAKIATQTVNVNYPGDFFDVQYKIPLELTRGKSKVTVKFQPHGESIAGGLFGCLMLK